MLLPWDEDAELLPQTQQPAAQPAPQQAASMSQKAVAPSCGTGDLLLMFDEDTFAPAASSSGEPYPSVQKPPPPPPPPPKADLDEVWTPWEESSIQGCLVKEKTGELLLGTDAAMAAVLFGVDAPLREEESRRRQVDRGMNLLDLEDSSFPPACGGSDDSEFAKVVAESLENDKKGRLMLDLSDPAERAAEAARQLEKEKEKEQQRRRQAAGGGASSSSTAHAGPAKPIPTDSKGFGSDDMFGKRAEDRSLLEQGRDEGISAYNTIKAMLPDNVQLQMPACTAPPNADEETEVIITASPVRGAAGAPPRRQTEPNSLEEEHEQRAVNRALEGRWVPTYMRDQLVANGHTAMPNRPNGHEFNATAPPPSLGDAMGGIAADLGETAQTVFEFFASLLSTFTVQCQVCSAHSASTAHEHILNYGENLCRGGQADVSTELILGRPVEESMAGLGPMRSRAQRILPGVSFEDLTMLVKTKLVTGAMPLSLSQVVRSREVCKTAVQQYPPVEDFMFNTELNPEAVPEAFVQHLCRRADHPVQRVALRCQESWHVELEQGEAAKAMVEMTTAPSNGSVVITIRIDITRLPPSQGVGCYIESRVYAKRREFGEVLPVGLVEQLATLHNIYADALQGVVTSVAEVAQGTGPTAHWAAPQSSSGRLVAEQRPPEAPQEPRTSGSCAAEAGGFGAPAGFGRPQGPSALQGFGSAGCGLDADMLLKVANAI